MSAVATTKARAKTAVSYVGSAKNSGTTGASATVTLPAGLSNGDFAVYSVTAHGTATVAPPGSTTLIGSTESTSTSVTLYAYTATVNAADSSTVKTFTLSGTTNQSWVVVVSVYRNVGGYATLPIVHKPHGNEPLNNRPPRFSSVYCSSDSMVVACVGSYPTLSTAANAALMDTPPTGYTVRQTESKANNALQIPRGGSIIDSAGTTLAHNTFTFLQISHYAAVLMVLSPVSPRWAYSDKIPSTLASKPVVVYSTSSSAYVKQPESNWGYLTKNPWGERIMSAMGSSANSRNYSMPGSKAADICTAVFGTASYSTRAVSGEEMAISRAVTWASLPAVDALYLTDLIGNDTIAAVDSSQTQAGVVHACRSIFRRLRSSAFITSQNGSITYGGTWSNGTSTGTTGGIYKQTTTPGSTLSYTMNNATGAPYPWDFVLVGFGSGTTGSTYTVKLDGVTYTTGTTNAQMTDSGWGGGNDYKFVQMTIPVTIPTGSHTVVIEHTGTSGHVLRVDSIQVQATTPPWIVTNTLGIMPTDAYTTYPELNLTKQNAYNALLQSVCDEFADGRVFLYNPSASGIVNGETQWFASDYVHQTEMYHAHYSREILRKLQERVA